MRSIDVDVVLMNPERHAPVSTMDALRRQNADIACLQGERTRMLVRLAVEGEGDEFLPEEVAVELRCSPVSARNRLHQARRMCERLPATVSALCAGQLDWARARALEEITAPLSAEQAAAVEDWTLARAGGKPYAAFVACARRRVLRVDPGGAAEPAHARHAERRVWLRPLDDGMAELGAHLPAALATAAFTRIDRLARRSRAAGDERPLDVARADTAADLLLGHDTGADTAVRIDLTIDAATLAGLREHPAELSGYGPLDAATARMPASDATWRRIITDPATGTVLDVGRRRHRPPAALAEHVIRRDATCRFPGCPRPAHTCDLDHTESWHTGGITAAGNLGSLCRRHHRLKHESGWTLAEPRPGHFRLTTPRGTARDTAPGCVAEPAPP